MSIKRYAITPAEREALELYEQLGSQRKVADRLGVSKTAIGQRLNSCRLKQASMGAFTPAIEPTGHHMTKTTVEYDADGNPVREWRRLSPEADALEKFVETLCERSKGKGTAPKPRLKSFEEDQLLEIAISDAHIGMYAWASETGAGDYDVKLATETVVQAVSDLAARCRPKETIIVFNGDTMHSDTRKMQTEHSGHILDVDGRYSRVLDHTIDCLTQSVDICSSRTEKVKVLVTPGNHDWHTSICLSRILHAYYHKCPNVEVIVSARPRYAMQWGDCMLAWAHGDRIKPGQWASIIPTEFSELWGRTKMRYLHLGHVHHKKQFAPVMVDEQCGLVVEYLSALCQTDAWAAESGYIGSIRGADGFLYNERGLDTRWSFNADRYAGRN
jgi:predicted DNA-binding protein (UPF0251 family)